MPPVTTKFAVRVIARAGKFLGDDIGGAEVVIRDVRTGELLAHGRTHGGSRPTSLMTTPLQRTQPIPVPDPPNNDACPFHATLFLQTAPLVEISAYGPPPPPPPANRPNAPTWGY